MGSACFPSFACYILPFPELFIGAGFTYTFAVSELFKAMLKAL